LILAVWAALGALTAAVVALVNLNASPPHYRVEELHRVYSPALHGRTVRVTGRVRRVFSFLPRETNGDLFGTLILEGASGRESVDTAYFFIPASVQPGRVVTVEGEVCPGEAEDNGFRVQYIVPLKNCRLVE
jgi:hypothetical protein